MILETGDETSELFKLVLTAPSEMTARGLSAYLKALKTRGESVAARPYAVALERRRADPFAPLAMTLIGAPLAFAFGRRSTLTAVCAAIVFGLTFWAVLGGFQQLGSYGLLAPFIAAWSPTVIFASVGLYCLSRSRT
jgi:lipopolysaccharide export LptBFGC system permease protein LptF